MPIQHDYKKLKSTWSSLFELFKVDSIIAKLGTRNSKKLSDSFRTGLSIKVNQLVFTSHNEVMNTSLAASVYKK